MRKEQLAAIIERHKKWLKGDYSGYRADLSRADLPRADLSGADLSRANLSEANLFRVDLSEANLSGANLSRANLSGANLCNADLSRANLSEANLSGANLFGAFLIETESDFSVLIGISGLRFPVFLKDDLVRIGCQEHTYNTWKNFKTPKIEEMADNALEFYNMIMPILGYHYKNTKWEIKS